MTQTKPCAYLGRMRWSLNDLRNRRITDTYSVHREVYNLFKIYYENGEKLRILYDERPIRSMMKEIYVLSTFKPVSADQSIDLQPISESFLQLNQYAFQVVVNPSRQDAKSRKRLSVVGQSAIQEWFSEKGPQFGFVIKDPKNLDVLSVWKDSFSGKAKKQLTISKARLSGVLEVVDHHKFRRAVLNGVGRSKAFGCGLLQVMPVRI